LATVIFLAGGLVSISTFAKDVRAWFYRGVADRPRIQIPFRGPAAFRAGKYCVRLCASVCGQDPSSKLAESGKTVGSLYALSTVGSIVGTFLAGSF
jgi:hypothetical protein